ncbi:uncharacterized protein LOC110818623 isoform X2 [Carica papaya]|uniref:uncharacterized protein LOC110818623 isoform X2 n=1 Tax=Carica papaya TaxID=3649 RepID=UPI000B8CE7F8|nr:uncharacterized protein LOC110818623 isoform X2 [Carica papaya]
MFDHLIIFTFTAKVVLRYHHGFSTFCHGCIACSPVSVLDEVVISTSFHQLQSRQVVPAVKHQFSEQRLSLTMNQNTQQNYSPTTKRISLSDIPHLNPEGFWKRSIL